MPLAIGNKVIKVICKLHSVKYGVTPKPANDPIWHDGYCDVCEATGNNNVPQNVTPIASFGGIKGDIFQKITVKQP